MPAILGDAPALATMMNIVRPVMPDLAEFEAEDSAVRADLVKFVDALLEHGILIKSEE